MPYTRRQAVLDSQPQESTPYSAEWIRHISAANNWAAPNPDWVKVNSPTQQAGPGGISIAGNASSSYATRPIPSTLTQPMWMLVYFVAPAPATTSLTYYAISAETGSTPNATALLRNGDGTNTNLNFLFRGTNAGGFNHKNGPVLTEGKLYCAVCVVPTGTTASTYMYVNGIKYNTAAATDANATMGGASLVNETVDALKRNTVTGVSNYKILLTAHGIGADKLLSEAQACALSINPWLLYESGNEDSYISTGGGATITIDPASFSLTATAIGSLYNRASQIDSASFALAATDVGSLYHHASQIDLASFALTATEVGSLYHHASQIDSASFALTATDVSTQYARITSADSASFALTVTDVGSLYHHASQIDSASFALTAASVNTQYARITGADFASFLLTATDVGALYHRVSQIDSAPYSLSPSEVGSFKNRITSADSASFAVAVADIGSLYNRVSRIDSAAFILAPAAITSTYNTSIVTPARGSMTLSDASWGSMVLSNTGRGSLALSELI